MNKNFVHQAFFNFTSTVVFLLFLFLSSTSFAQNNPAPWYGVKAQLGTSTGKCIETSSGAAVKNLADMGATKIISEKNVDGKVNEITFSFQGSVATIYRDKSTCETAAVEMLKKQKSSKEKYN